MAAEIGCVFAIVANPILHDPLHGWLLRQMKWLLPLSVVVLLGTFLDRDESFRETLRYPLQGLALIPLFIAAILLTNWPGTVALLLARCKYHAWQ